MEDLNLINPDPRPTRADAVKNRELLLETAQRLFDDEGVETVTMTQIAEEAGVGKGTLYRHFSNKNDICHALLDQDMHDLQAATLAHAREGSDPLTTLRWFLESVAAFVMRNQDLLYSGLDSSPALSVAQAAHLWWRQTIRGYLRQLNVTGDLDYLTDTLYMMLDVNTIRFQMHNLGYERQRILDGLNDLLTRLIGDD